MRRILAFDAALWRTGWAVLDDGQLVESGVIGRSGKDRISQLGHIWLSTGELVLRWWHLDIVAIESSATWQRNGHDSGRTRDALAQARAVIELGVTYASDCHIVERDCHEVRETICGSRSASKSQVQENLRLRGYELPVMANGKTDPDIADAVCLGAAVWALERLRAMKHDEEVSQ
ncbi:MAG: crossover junction endodeoxyribonuclease RuvC [Chloroflexi bacterium]|nr:crossover junction endodeoxyribonuclease RuvC [Chloroflexota bacterium]